MKQIRSFVGMDVHKATISISVAEDGRSGSVRFIGVIPNTPEAVQKMAKQLARHGELDFCYEASGCPGMIAYDADDAASACCSRLRRNSSACSQLLVFCAPANEFFVERAPYPFRAFASLPGSVVRTRAISRVAGINRQHKTPPAKQSLDCSAEVIVQILYRNL
jgi:hypothetical protein